VKTTLNQLISTIENAERLFDQAAKAWVRGNNSGNTDTLSSCQDKTDRLRAEGEALLKPFGIECDYPGLYPSFKVNGYDEHSIQSAISAAVGEIFVVTPKEREYLRGETKLNRAEAA